MTVYSWEEFLVFGWLQIVSDTKFISCGQIQVSVKHKMLQELSLFMTYSELCAKPWQLSVSAIMLIFSFSLVSCIFVLVGSLEFSGFSPVSVHVVSCLEVEERLWGPPWCLVLVPVLIWD